MLLQDKLNAFKKDFESGKPPFNVSPDAVKTMHRATDELQNSDILDGAPRVGNHLPAFDLATASGDRLTNAILDQGPLVLSFYRGVWCPYCNMELQALQESIDDIRGAGASLAAISPQTAANSKKSQAQNKLDFPILVDEGNAFARELGLVFKLPDDLIEVYKGLGATLNSFNGDDSWELPMPARMVIDQAGTIVYADVNPDYTQRPDPSELLPVLDRLKIKRAS